MRLGATSSVIGLIFAASSLLAQSAPIAASFRQVPTAQGRGGAAFEASCENRSGKAIAAYVFRFDHKTPDGKIAAREALTTMTRGLGLAKGRDSFKPGESWIDRLPVRGSEMPEVALDLVVYEDGTYWGDNKTKKLDWIFGVKAGARIERAR